MTDWMVKAANFRNAQRHHHEHVEAGADALWDNICRAVDRIVRQYPEFKTGLHARFSGNANHTIWVAVYHGPQQTQEQQRERITITFNDHVNAVEVRRVSDPDRIDVFPMTLNEREQVTLSRDREFVSIDQFTEIALKDALFPPWGPR